VLPEFEEGYVSGESSTTTHKKVAAVLEATCKDPNSHRGRQQHAKNDYLLESTYEPINEKREGEFVCNNIRIEFSTPATAK
jgi:hypothetical protein